MKTRRVVVGGGLVLIVAALLSLFWRGPGRGGSGEDGEITDRNARVEARNGASPDRTPQAASDTPREKTPAEAGETDLVQVVVHEDRYRLTGDDPRNGPDVTLEEVLKRVAAVPGNPRGIRLRIRFERSAQEGAIAALHAALEGAGVKREEIQEHSDFVD